MAGKEKRKEAHTSYSNGGNGSSAHNSHAKRPEDGSETESVHKKSEDSSSSRRNASSGRSRRSPDDTTSLSSTSTLSTIIDGGGGASGGTPDSLQNASWSNSEHTSLSGGRSDSNSGASSGWTCVVCCQKVPGPVRRELYAIGPCDHPVCAECCTKMRVLCDQDECPICRQEIAKVMFTSNRDQKYASINFNQIKLFNSDYLIYFENEAAERTFNTLLRHPCRICRSRDSSSNSFLPSSTPRSWEFRTLKELDAHLRREHELFLCDLCVENLKVFSHERKYYSRKDLVRHRKTGDPEDTSHRGHPLCKFCDVRYMDDDDLHRHLRKDHYYCHFCDPLGLNQFYDSYCHLRDHFRAEHFLCEDGQCREERFTSVFRSDIDLQAHRAQFHCNSRLEAKEARILNLDFSLKPRSGQGGGSGGVSAQISASIDHRSGFSSRRTGERERLLGAVGGAEIEEEDGVTSSEPPPPQQLPKPEDFPSLSNKEGLELSSSPTASATAGVAASASLGTSSSLSGMGGPHASSSTYTELAEKYKDNTQKTKKKMGKGGNAASFSSRIGGGSFASGRLDEDFPALPGFMCPTGSGSAGLSRKELKSQAATSSKYANTLSSVAAAVTSTVPRVVSKVATATCLPSSSGNSLMSCSPGQGVSPGNKTLSTQSLLSSTSTSTTATSTAPAFSMKSSADFPSLPVIEKKGAKSRGNINAAFSASSESFSHLHLPSTSTTKSTSSTAPGGPGKKASLKGGSEGKQLDFASKLSAASSGSNNKKSSVKATSTTTTSSSFSNGGVITLRKEGEVGRTNKDTGKGCQDSSGRNAITTSNEGKGETSTASLSSSTSGGERKVTEDGNRDKIRLKGVGASGPTEDEKTAASTSSSGLQNKSLLLKNDNEFPGLEPSASTTSKTTTRISNSRGTGTSKDSKNSANTTSVSGRNKMTSSSTSSGQQEQQRSSQQQQGKQVISSSSTSTSTSKANNKSSSSTGRSKNEKNSTKQSGNDSNGNGSNAPTSNSNNNNGNKGVGAVSGGGGNTTSFSSSSGSGTEKLNSSRDGGEKGTGSGVKKPPPPPPSSSSSSSSSSTAFTPHSHSRDSQSHGKTSKESISLSSVAQVLMGSCGSGGSSSSPASSSSHNHGKSLASNKTSSSPRDENGNVNSEVGGGLTSSSSFTDGDGVMRTSTLSSSSCNSNDKEVTSNRLHPQHQTHNNTSSSSSSGVGGGGRNALLTTSTGFGNNANHSSPSSFPPLSLSTSSGTTTEETFLPPTNFEERNLSLVKEVSDILKDHNKFSAFRKISNDFRRGETKGDEYYKKCIELFGRNNFNKVFNELITLLPNVRKQNELLTAHEKNVKMNQGAVPKNTGHHGSSQSGNNSGVWVLNNPTLVEQGLLVCPTCQQVLAKRDGPEHMSSHRL